jgi:hypothetical protein
MTSSNEISRPFVRAINIYRRLAKHDVDDQLHRELARHFKRLAELGVRDQGQLTVQGLSYLQRHRSTEAGRRSGRLDQFRSHHDKNR